MIEASDHLAYEQRDHHGSGANLRDQPRNGEHQARAEDARRQQDRVHILERTERAAPPAGQTDGDSANRAYAPEKSVAYAGVVQHTAHFAVHRQMHGPTKTRQEI
jgi:hypothetical protein